MIEKIAITGGIAEGKSTILRILNEFGILTFSCDQCVKELYRKPEMISLLQKEVHCDPLNETRKFTLKFFNDLEFREKVEAIVHPLVLEKIRQSPANYIEVPLLYEKKLNPLFKEIWVVTCGRKTQWKRLIHRLQDPDLATYILNLQWPTTKKISLANHIINTNRPIYQIRKQVDLLLKI